LYAYSLAAKNILRICLYAITIIIHKKYVFVEVFINLVKYTSKNNFVELSK